MILEKKQIAKRVAIGTGVVAAAVAIGYASKNPKVQETVKNMFRDRSVEEIKRKQAEQSAEWERLQKRTESLLKDVMTGHTDAIKTYNKPNTKVYRNKKTSGSLTYKTNNIKRLNSHPFKQKYGGRVTKPMKYTGSRSVKSPFDDRYNISIAQHSPRLLKRQSFATKEYVPMTTVRRTSGARRYGRKKNYKINKLR